MYNNNEELNRMFLYLFSRIGEVARELEDLEALAKNLTETITNKQKGEE